MSLAVETETKWCPGCEDWQPVTRFSRAAYARAKGRTDGYQYYCKACMAQAQRASVDREAPLILEPIQRLAAAVIGRAIKDSRGVDLHLFNKHSPERRAAKRVALMQAGQDWLASEDAACWIDVAFTDRGLNDEALVLLDALVREGA